MGMMSQYMQPQATGLGIPVQAQMTPALQQAPNNLRLTPEIIKLMEEWVKQQKAAGNPQFVAPQPAPNAGIDDALAQMLVNARIKQK